MSGAEKALEAELAAWTAAGLRPSFWWRDDDAAQPNQKLIRLLRIAAETHVPVALAVIPMRTGPELASLLADMPGRSLVLQHGYAHVNHAGPDEKKAEFTAARPVEAMAAEIAEGRARLQSLFEGRLQPIFVPPWNRFPDLMLPHLPALGIGTISTFGPRKGAQAAPGLIRFNTHVDPIDWRQEKRFVGRDAFFDAIRRHLAARRDHRVDADEPTGILTHHEVFDEEAFAALGDALALLARHGR